MALSRIIQNSLENVSLQHRLCMFLMALQLCVLCTFMRRSPLKKKTSREENVMKISVWGLKLYAGTGEVLKQKRNILDAIAGTKRPFTRKVCEFLSVFMLPLLAFLFGLLFIINLSARCFSAAITMRMRNYRISSRAKQERTEHCFCTYEY